MDIIIGIILIVLGLGCIVISLLQFREKGFLFNNAYIWVSEDQRQSMDKKPYYRQSAIAFALAAAILLLVGVECIFNTGVLMIFVGLFAVAALVYAIVSSVRLDLHK